MINQNSEDGTYFMSTFTGDGTDWRSSCFTPAIAINQGQIGFHNAATFTRIGIQSHHAETASLQPHLFQRSTYSGERPDLPGRLDETRSFSATNQSLSFDPSSQAAWMLTCFAIPVVSMKGCHPLSRRTLSSTEVGPLTFLEGL
jgi:hypothetical protein